MENDILELQEKCKKLQYEVNNLTQALDYLCNCMKTHTDYMNGAECRFEREHLISSADHLRDIVGKNYPWEVDDGN